MKNYTCERYISIKSFLGEGPVWDEKTGILYWLDGLGCKWHKRLPDGTIQSFETPSPIGTLALSKEDGFGIAGLKDGVCRINLEDGSLIPFADPEAGLDTNRYNDGKADPAGNLVIGTMSTANNDGSGEAPPAGSLYSIAPDGSFTVLAREISISNGLAWTKNHDILYYVDSPTRCVTAFDYDKTTGKATNPRVALTLPEEDGIPDGMTIDENDNLWIAQWGGSCVTHYNPRTGELLGKISVPAKFTTCCIFGGKDMDTLYITTALGEAGGEPELDQPEAGMVFVAKPGVKGCETFRFGR